MVRLVVEHILPAAELLLPPATRSLEARALLTAIGLQESRFLFRRQLDQGPARGFWQFEPAGVRAVLQHPRSRPLVLEALRELRYSVLPYFLLVKLLENNDVLAAVFARCLLWTDRAPLPGPEAAEEAWEIYLRTWRPGRPHKATWRPLYTEAWCRVQLPAPRKDSTDASRFDRR